MSQNIHQQEQPKREGPRKIPEKTENLREKNFKNYT